MPLQLGWWRWRTIPFDEGPLEVVVRLFDHAAIVHLAAAALDPGDQAGIAGQVLGVGEAVNGADFSIDDDG